MNNIDFRESYSKDLLRHILRMKETSFKKWLRTLEPDVLNIDATYNRRCSILKPKVFRFLVREYGFEDADELSKMISSYYESLKIKRKVLP